MRTPQKILVAIAIVFGFSVAASATYAAMTFGRWRIPQDGMFPGFPAGTHLVARKSPYGSVADVRRGDVVIYKVARDGVRYDFIWRVVGLPGERVAVHADTVVVNGRELPRRWLREQGDLTIFEETTDDRKYEIALPAVPDEESEYAEIQVPAAHIFVLGDNRHNAVDSRRKGTVPFETIVAKAIWSWR